MSARRVIVIGDGAAGLAAAWSARRSGASVTVVARGAGASSFTSGAVDDEPWEAVARRVKRTSSLAAEPLSEELRAFVDEVGLWSVGATAHASVVTMPGRVRPARGCDRALLDVASLERGVLFVADAPRPNWDARALVASLAESGFLHARALEARKLDAPVLRFDAERRIPDGDLAARHDDDERLAWLGARLREAIAGSDKVAGVLVGPWLGAAAPRAEALSKIIGVPVGEALSGLGGAAGLRFEAARDRVLASSGVERVRGNVKRVERDKVTLEDDRALACAAVVLAVGGLAGGGVLYDPPDHEAGTDAPAVFKASFKLSLDAPVALGSLGANDSVLGISSSIHGPVLDAVAWPSGERAGALESVGVRCQGARAGEGVFACGDAVAGRARTMIEALRSGIAAGRAATSAS